jgi:hypothetical protein
MTPKALGVEQFTEEDRAYKGSRFSEVRDAIFANPYQKVWGGPGEPPWPAYRINVESLLRGILPFGKPWAFFEASKRAVDSRADLRWGPDGKGFRRLLHPNGICLTGTWEITEETEYTGYFRKGSRALVVGRYSTCCSPTRRPARSGYKRSRSLALVGKLWPTTDPNHAEPLRTANFYSIQDVGGDYTHYMNDAEFHNAPDTRFWRRFPGLPSLLATGAGLLLTDRRISVRQLYEIAELGQSEGQPTRTPEFLRIRVAPDQPRIEGDDLDLRDEVMAQIFDKGDPVPKRTLTFHIDVTDEGKTYGALILELRTFKNWRHIGKITFDNAVASYNGDFVIHFNHPPWRADPNDPATVHRKPR